MTDPVLPIYVESADPEMLRAWLRSFGWTGQVGEHNARGSSPIREFGPYEERVLLGKQTAFAMVVAREPITLPEGIYESSVGLSIAGGVIGEPPLPTVIEWMDRLPDERQADLLDALQSSKETRRFYARMLAAGNIDPRHPNTIAGVQAMLHAGVLTVEEADKLLAAV